MDYGFSQLQLEIAGLAREVAQKKLKPLRAKADIEEKLPPEVVQEYRDSNLFGLWLPEKYGGTGGGVTDLALAIEELSKVCGGLALPIATSALGGMPVFMWATAEQREKWIPALASGEKLFAFALTEAEAGSDATALKTTAVLQGDHYVVNGSKHFISTGEVADCYTVAVSTNPKRGARGITLLLIEKGTPGFTFGKKEEKLGIRGNTTYELVFQDVKVPVANRIGPEGMGLLAVQETFDYSRPGVAAQALGIAEGALNETIPYLRTRKQFGQPVSSFQAIQHKLADLATKVEAGRALVYAITLAMDKDYQKAVETALASGASVHDELKKLKTRRWTKESAMSKLFCSDTAMEVASECVNLCGGIAYMRDFPVEKYMRDAKITQIYEGTNHIQRNEIAAALIKEYAAGE
ncbi:MAG TPA: acyl-CoA dehydrogenase family protein [Elusimicrobiales bacterium]|nr:acyl-CoA dehydrogenase family protein [Elusimicrobiales bacterium]